MERRPGQLNALGSTHNGHDSHDLEHDQETLGGKVKGIVFVQYVHILFNVLLPDVVVRVTWLVHLLHLLLHSALIFQLLPLIGIHDNIWTIVIRLHFVYFLFLVETRLFIKRLAVLVLFDGDN